MSDIYFSKMKCRNAYSLYMPSIMELKGVVYVTEGKNS